MLGKVYFFNYSHFWGLLLALLQTAILLLSLSHDTANLIRTKRVSFPLSWLLKALQLWANRPSSVVTIVPTGVLYDTHKLENSFFQASLLDSLRL